MARPMTPRRAVEALTVLVATSVAVLAIMLPISFASLTAAVHVDLLVFNIPRAMTGAAFVAAITAAVTMAVGSIRTTRWTALLALAGILVNHLVLVPDGGDGELHTLSLPTLNFIDALLAGVAFGAIAVAVWSEPLLRTVYLFAAVGATIMGDLTQSPTDAGADSFARILGSTLPLWFLAASVLALGYLAVTDAPTPRAATDTAIPLAPIFAAVVAFSTIIVTSQALSSTRTSTPQLIIGAMVVVAAAATAATILPGRDGILVLLMTGFAVAGSLVITLPRAGWVDVVILVAVAVGLLAGQRAPRPLVAAASVVVLAMFTFTVDSLHPPVGVAVTVGCLALGLISGYCVGASIPTSPASATVGLAVLFVPSLGVALSDSEFGHLAYSPSWYRTVDVDRGPVPATVAVGMALGCAVAIAALLRYRSAPEEASE